VAGLGDALAAARDDAPRLDEAIGALREEVGADRDRLAELQQAVDRLDSAVIAAADQGTDAIRAELVAVRDAAQEGTTAIRAELAAVRDVADRANQGVEALRAELELLRREVGAAHTQADLATAVAEKAKHDDARVQQLQADVQSALTAIEELKHGAGTAPRSGGGLERQQAGGDHVNAMFREILDLAAAKSGTLRPRPMSRPPEPEQARAREARAGFDDEPMPLAVIGLDGKFKELNPAFARLVGYQEHEFGKATWPSPHDRQHYAQQQEQFAELVSGELERVVVQSTYMHGQGLMVPVIGEISVVTGADGHPSHLLLRAEERERTG
jgi:PAS domain S-box-containing protein